MAADGYRSDHGAERRGISAARIRGAGVRAVLVAAAVISPALMVPSAGPEGVEISLVMAALAGIFVLYEYGARTPALVVFRQAPPVNRLRFAIFCVTLIAVTTFVAAPEGGALREAGLGFGHAAGGPWSPAGLAAEALRRPSALGPEPAMLAAASIAVVVAAVATTLCAGFIWLGRWPGDVSAFDRWSNLPTFDPEGAEDAPERLAARARLVFLTGAALPVALLAGARLAEGVLAPDAFSGGLTLVWGATLWAAGSGAVLLRGVAMLKLARRLRRHVAGSGA